MIHSLTVDSLRQVCEICTHQHTISVADLKVGQEHLVDHTVVVMPICECGAREFLNRTHDNPGPHAYLVNSLHEHLVDLDQVHETSRDHLTAEQDHEKPTHRGTLTGEPLVVPQPVVDQASNEL